jgi:hypothetical protein
MGETSDIDTITDCYVVLPLVAKAYCSAFLRLSCLLFPCVVSGVVSDVNGDRESRYRSDRSWPSPILVVVIPATVLTGIIRDQTVLRKRRNDKKKVNVSWLRPSEVCCAARHGCGFFEVWACLECRPTHDLNASQVHLKRT